jgi:uncharacterized protein
VSDNALVSFTAFDGTRRIARGALPDVAIAAKRAIEGGAAGPVHIYSDGTGRIVDVNMSGSDDEMLERLRPHDLPVEEPRGRGRPKLGVVAREVTLLPRHWDWLASQPGGASVALRKLVEEARRANGDKDRARASQEITYRFMSAMAGDLPGFEEASRALFAGDGRRLAEQIASWPPDVRDQVATLAFAGEDAGS